MHVYIMIIQYKLVLGIMASMEITIISYITEHAYI